MAGNDPMTLLDKVRLALRLASDDTGLDAEINDCISACYKDLDRAGAEIFDDTGAVRDSVESDSLIVQCQKLYARWQFNYENAADRYEKAYKDTRDGISLCEDYRGTEAD